MKIFRSIFTTLSFLLLVSCAAPGPVFQPMIEKDGVATLYIYRLKKFKGGGTYPHIYVNGKEKAPLRNGGYISTYLNPGEYTVLSRGKDWKWDLPDSRVKIAVEPGVTYYIKLDYDLDIGVSDSGKQKSQNAWPGSLWMLNYGASFHPVSPEVGSKEIKTLKQSY